MVREGAQCWGLKLQSRKLGMNSTSEPTLALGNSSHMTTHTLRKMDGVKPEVAARLHTSSKHSHPWYLHRFRKPGSEICLCYKAKRDDK